MLMLRFSHDYPKLHKQSRAQLIKVYRTERKELDDELIEYDTLTSDGEHYELPKGDLIYLLFLGNKMIPFCTIRPYNPGKFDYYQRNVGKIFTVCLPRDVRSRRFSESCDSKEKK